MVIRNSDDKWLDVLSGATSKDEADSNANLEPAWLRKAIQKRINNRPSHVPTEAGFSRLLDSAKHADLLKEGSPSIGSKLIERILQLIDPPSSDRPKPTGAIWSASTMIGGFFSGVLGSSSSSPALRGGTTGEVILRVSDPLNVSLVWQRELTNCGIDHATVILDQSHFLIRFTLGKTAQDLLIDHDIPPPPGAVCTLVIESNKKD